MRAPIYARFSSDLQDERSITDQVALARKYAETRSLIVTNVYQDAAISGASTINRPGLHRLIADAAASKYEIIVTESLDRLSRSQADIAALYEKLTFHGIRVETLADGLVSEIHVGLKGTMSALFLKDLAQKTRRGQIGRVKAGRIPGGKSYGYDIVKSDEDRGRRTINAHEAAIVRRIFQEYADGKGPLSIVADLNRDGVPGPRGGRWNASALLGSPKRRNGLLNNEVYGGIIVYNRQRFLKDPATGKRIARENPESEWLRQDVPELRIIDDETWHRVQGRRASRSNGPRLHHRRRPKRLLSGLLRCGCCGGPFNVVHDDRMRCSTLQNSKDCANTRTVRTAEVEERVLIALRKYLLAPDVVASAVEAYRAERIRLAEQRRRKRHTMTREVAAIDRKLKTLLDMAMDRQGDLRVLKRQMLELEAEQDRIKAELARDVAAPTVALHPQAAEHYRSKVGQIHEALTEGNAASREAITILRDLIDHIRVSPTERPAPVELLVVGNLAALLIENTPATEVAVSMVAGVGFEPTTFRL